MLGSRLRRLDELQCRQQNTCTRLQQAGLNVRLTEADAHQRYLHLQVESGTAAFDAYLQVDAWFSRQFPDLAGLAWAAADDDLLLDLLRVELPRLSWPQGWLAGAGIRVMDFSSPVGRLISLQTDQGEVLCPSLPEGLLPEAPLATWLQRLPLKTTVSLGAQSMGFDQFSRIETGDVLMLLSQKLQLICNGRALFCYSLQQEHLMLEQALPVAESEPVAPNVLPLSYGQIPLNIEFVLQDLTLSLDQLNSMAPGQLISLNPDAERNVQLRANGILIARGELVELNQQLGVEITQLVLGA